MEELEMAKAEARIATDAFEHKQKLFNALTGTNLKAVDVTHHLHAV